MSETVRDGAEGNWQASYLPAEAGCPTSRWRSQTLMMDTAHGRGKGSRKLGTCPSLVLEGAIGGPENGKIRTLGSPRVPKKGEF